MIFGCQQVLMFPFCLIILQKNTYSRTILQSVFQLLIQYWGNWSLTWETEDMSQGYTQGGMSRVYSGWHVRGILRVACQSFADIHACTQYQAYGGGRGRHLLLLLRPFKVSEVLNCLISTTGNHAEFTELSPSRQNVSSATLHIPPPIRAPDPRSLRTVLPVGKCQFMSLHLEGTAGSRGKRCNTARG